MALGTKPRDPAAAARSGWHLLLRLGEAGLSVPSCGGPHQYEASSASSPESAPAVVNLLFGSHREAGPFGTPRVTGGPS